MLPDNVIGTIEQRQTFYVPEPQSSEDVDGLRLAGILSARLRQQHTELAAMLPDPDAEQVGQTLFRLSLPALDIDVNNVVQITHVELRNSSVVLEDGTPLVQSLRFSFLKAMFEEV